MRNLILFVFLLGFSFKGFSQKPISELYTSYTIIRTTETSKPAAIEIALSLLQRSTELTNTQIANVNFHLGRLYEEVLEEDKAIPYYEASLKLAPDYYVTHRALANIYLKQSTPIVQKMNEAGKAQQTAVYGQLFATYKKLILKALPHFEKAQACDADEQTLQQITNLYKNIKDTTSMATLPTRLKSMAVTCVDLLDD